MYEDSFSFTYKHVDGNTYTAEVILEVEPATDLCYSHALSDWEVQDHVDITEINVMDSKGDLIFGVDPSDEHILREWELEVSMREDIVPEDSSWINL